MKPLKTLVLNTITFGMCSLALAGCQTLQTFVNDVETTFSQITSPSSDNNAQPMAADGPDAPHAKAMIETAVVSADFCPQVEIVEELSSLSEFSDPASPDQSDLISRVNLSQVESTCEHKDKTIVVDLKLAFESTLGPRGVMRKGDRPFFSYPFFVAVTDPQGEIMAKEVFAASMTFRAGEDRHTYYESLRQIIPHTGTKHQASLHKVLIGFQLSQSQLDYNRAFMRKRASARIEKPQMAILPVYNAQGEAPAQPATATTATAASKPAPARKAMEPILLTPRAKPEQPMPIEPVAEAAPAPAPAPAPEPEPVPEQEPVEAAVTTETTEETTEETTANAAPPSADALSAPEVTAPQETAPEETVQKTAQDIAKDIAEDMPEETVDTSNNPDLLAPAAIEPQAGSAQPASSVFQPSALDITAPIE